jgi:predicted RNA-binding protein YlqC (UPF0109 family)
LRADYFLIDRDANMAKKNEAKPRKSTTADEDLLVDLVAAFCQHARDIGVNTQRQGGENVMIEFDVNRDDHPRVVGGQGKHITALRTIFEFIGAREARRIRLMLKEPTRGQRGLNAPFKANFDWDAEPTVKLLRRVLDRILVHPLIRLKRFDPVTRQTSRCAWTKKSRKLLTR